MSIHLIFDLLAALASVSLTVFLARGPLAEGLARVERIGWPWYAAFLIGAVWGAFALGTLNLVLSGTPGIGRSILGALIGAILMVEIAKRVMGASGSTGILFVPAFTLTTVIGRIGCFLSGLDDQTHGIPTALPWGVDWGDGPRHPVQLYESASMAMALVVWLWMIRWRPEAFRKYGFYLLCIAYGGERFLWEFLKPYGAVLGPLNVFHIGCLALIGYGTWMIARARKPA